ncbi:hypothetical protein BRN55_10945, partial [Xanthomonas oryzae pv. oryzae]
GYRPHSSCRHLTPATGARDLVGVSKAAGHLAPDRGTGSPDESGVERILGEKLPHLAFAGEGLGEGR